MNCMLLIAECIISFMSYCAS